MNVLLLFLLQLYPNDPLPKNICKKCISNVSFMYMDIQRVLKTQNKWVNNVRSNQPDHNYICILDMIENANRGTRDSIKSIMGEDICMHSIERLALAFTKEEPVTETVTAESTSSPHMNCLSETVQVKIENEMEIETKKETQKLNDIKSILELNGCSLLTVGNKRRAMAHDREKKTKKLEIPQTSTSAKPNAELDQDDSDEGFATTTTELVLNSQLKGNSITVEPPLQTPAPPPPPLSIKCRYCKLSFKTLETLAAHQHTHLRLHVPRLFERRSLSKGVRRGRLITMQERKCIRCLNCWRVFSDNKSILDHWTRNECDFYCHICGKEFAQAPKMLREHVPAAHGISYRMAKLQHARFADVLLNNGDQSKNEIISPAPLKTEFIVSNTKQKSKPQQQQKQQKREACNICKKVFQNMKARNSHMRKHKASHAFGEVVLPPHSKSDGYIKVEQAEKYDDYMDEDKSPTVPTVPAVSAEPKIPFIKQEPVDEVIDKLFIPAQPTQPQPKAQTVRGVRTKFVSPRCPQVSKTIPTNNHHTISIVNNKIQIPATTTKSTSESLNKLILPAVSIKMEPLDIDELGSKCQVCQQPLLTNTLEQHVCF